MSALPAPQDSPGLVGPDRLLTVDEYAALGEVESGYTELIEGRIMMSPSPTPMHNIASFELAAQLKRQLPSHLRVVQDVDLDLEFVASDHPGFSRRPDLVVIEREAVDRVAREGGMLRASEVAVVIEIASPGSRRIDYRDKHGEYADAGIRHYWIVDLRDPVSVVACHLAGEFGYQNAPDVTGVFEATEPFNVRLDLDKLR
ncbi:Uma2 family endonuclease [Phytoactinopolyspora halotolerans]|uniref:Uma2 family endonuclease n=1 Tax=Phytoactinopolyspora halotolerans TaxID=1981512 RepID=A0A6L9SDI7_9ACTN|nr:Uma2 family endonuclease [Phytoactinopolyspora halotolerans]NEE02561.1 Uma2 family endonuclease [Phytoactinopolyspora halotolerans]